MSAELLGLLEKFCLPGDRKLARPFVIVPYAYASNRRIVLRVPGPIVGLKKGPPADQLDWDLFGLSINFVPLPVLPMPVVISCFECRGVGACNKCHTTGRHRCEIPVQFGRQAFSDVVLEQLYQLPGVMIAENPSDPFGPAPVFFSGGEGLVMPLSH